MRSHRGDLRLSNPDWNEYELLGGIRWLRAMLAASCGARPAAAPVARADVEDSTTRIWFTFASHPSFTSQSAVVATVHTRSKRDE